VTARRRAYARKGGSKKSEHSFVMLQHRMLKHPAFMRLSARACKALLFLCSQYTGSNNGDLTIAWKVAKRAGFTGNGNLRLATMELIEAGVVIQSRQGGRNRCSLFALAWQPIDHCGDGKLDILPTSVAPNDWLFKTATEPRRVQLSEPRAVQLEPPGVQSAGKVTGNLQH
jgi:hypothetical protein